MIRKHPERFCLLALTCACILNYLLLYSSLKVNLTQTFTSRTRGYLLNSVQSVRQWTPKQWKLFNSVQSVRQWTPKQWKLLNSVQSVRQWTPKQWKLRYIYDKLNLTAEEAKFSLPVTIRSRYLLSNNSLCETASGRSSVDVLFVIHTSPKNFFERMRLRRTILNASYSRPFEIRSLFLIGQDLQSPTLQADLIEEHRRFGDLLQGEFIDSYHNLSLKGVMGYNWVTHHCSHARFVMKIDDDTFVDTFKLFQRYLPLVSGRRAIFCNSWSNGTMDVLRKGKWKVDDRYFQNMTVYPFDYCSGFAVLITGDLIPSLYRAAIFTPVFWIDDIYLFGILPWVAGNVTFYNWSIYESYMNLNSFHYLKCLNATGLDCHTLAVHAKGPNMFERIWNMTLALRNLPLMETQTRRT